MSVFDETAIEAAARKIAVAAGRKEHDWAAFRIHTQIALTAYFKSLEGQGKMWTVPYDKFSSAPTGYDAINHESRPGRK